MSKRLNASLVKIHRSYTVDEVSNVLGVHKGTVRNWTKDGLEVCDGSRPMLILGRVLKPFLKERNQRMKRPCAKDQFYCMKCKKPQKSAGNMVEFLPSTKGKGLLIALCECCEGIVTRFSNLAHIEQMSRIWEVSIRGTKNT
ncbi:MAG: hypothetical protein ACI9SP_002457 [Arenicella sp.]|jgi:hypothetical protein